MAEDRIAVVCPACSAKMTAPARSATRSAKCPRCGNAVRVEPNPSAPAPDVISQKEFAALLDDRIEGETRFPAESWTVHSPPSESETYGVQPLATPILTPPSFADLYAAAKTKKPTTPNVPPIPLASDHAAFRKKTKSFNVSSHNKAAAAVCGCITIIAACFVVLCYSYRASESRNYGSSSGYYNSGSSSKTRITPENFLRIKNGMNHSDVTVILGKPDEQSEVLGIKIWTWRNGLKEITVLINRNGEIEGKTQKGLDE